MLGETATATGERQVRLGIVGCGRQAQRGLVPAAGRAAGIELAAVADGEPARCAAAAPGVPAFGPVDQLLEAGVDAVVIATPTQEHLAVARLIADARLPALVEKPPAPDLQGATELCSLPAPVWIGFNRRFDPDLEALRERLAGQSGVELALRLQFQNWLWRPHLPHDDAVLDLGTHLVDLARWLLGAEVARVRAPLLSAARASLQLDLGGCRATIECASNRFWREAVEVGAGDGRSAERQQRGGLIQLVLGRLGLRPRDQGFVTSLARQLEALGAALGERPAGQLATARDGVAAMAAVEAARASAAAGGEWRGIPAVAASAA
jgi:predicted dehydrogenase